jgi:hypothetical protein
MLISKKRKKLTLKKKKKILNIIVFRYLVSCILLRLGTCKYAAFVCSPLCTIEDDKKVGERAGESAGQPSTCSSLIVAVSVHENHPVDT